MRRDPGHPMQWTDHNLAVQNLVNASLILEGMKERISALASSEDQKSVLEKIESSLTNLKQTRMNIAELDFDTNIASNSSSDGTSQQPLYSGNPADYALSR